MRKLVKQVAVVALMGLPVIAGTATAAGASTKPHVKLSASGGSAKVVYTFAGPKSKIVGEGKTAVYKPDALSVAEDTSGNMCSPFIEEAEFKNTGTATAYLTIDGSYAATLSAGAHTFICSYGGTAGDQLTIGLSNKTGTKLYAGTLLITFSD